MNVKQNISNAKRNSLRRYSRLPLGGAVLALFLCPLAHATTFQLDQSYTDYHGGVGFGAGAGGGNGLVISGSYRDQSNGQSPLGSWIQGTVGAASATLTFAFDFETRIFGYDPTTGHVGNEVPGGQGPHWFRSHSPNVNGRNGLTVYAADGSFDGDEGWDREAWYVTETDLGVWNTGVSFLNGHGWGGDILSPLALIGKPRGPGNPNCAQGQVMCFDGESLFSWLAIQYSDPNHPLGTGDFALLSAGASVQFFEMPTPPTDTEVPEPASAVLLISSLLGGFAHKKRTSNIA